MDDTRLNIFFKSLAEFQLILAYPAVPLVQVVRLLLQLDDDVPGLLAGLVIALTGEAELVTAGHALLDVDLQKQNGNRNY